MRLRWWWGIYFLGVILCHPAYIPTFFLIPFGLEDTYERIFRWAREISGAEPILNFSYLHILWFVTFSLAYGTYLLHFILTWRAEKRRVFLLLMFSLVLIVSANVVGCHNMEIDHHNHPFQN